MIPVPILTREAIDAGALVASVAAADRGGIAMFLGVVRDHHAGRAVIELEYSGYEPMVERVAAELVTAAERRWPVRVALRHRLGRLAIGDAAVGIAVGGGHRDEAFAACRFLIEEVKRKLPIWKRERYADGTEAWVDPTAPDQLHLAAAPGTS
jgi:molybdopterin synthase catalytic subunit